MKNIKKILNRKNYWLLSSLFLGLTASLSSPCFGVKRKRVETEYNKEVDKHIKKHFKKEDILSKYLIDQILNIDLKETFMLTDEEEETLRTIKNGFENGKEIDPNKEIEAVFTDNIGKQINIFTRGSDSEKAKWFKKEVFNKYSDLINYSGISKTLTGHIYNTSSVIRLPNNKFASGSLDDNTIGIWDTATGDCLQTFTGHTDVVRSLIFLPDNKFASGSYDNTIKIWDIKTGKCLHTLTGHTTWIKSLILLENGKIASESYHRITKIWGIDPKEFTLAEIVLITVLSKRKEENKNQTIQMHKDWKKVYDGIPEDKSYVKDIFSGFTIKTDTFKWFSNNIIE